MTDGVGDPGKDHILRLIPLSVFWFGRFKGCEGAIDKTKFVLGIKGSCHGFLSFGVVVASSIPSSFKEMIGLSSIDFHTMIWRALFLMGKPSIWLHQRHSSRTKIPRNKKCRETGLGRKNGNLFAICNFDGKIAYEDIIRATEDFNYKYCIGAGRYGRVYKADLQMGQVVAVKKLDSSQGGEQTNQRSFEKETRALTETRHRNIVKLYGFCSHPRCSFLVYQYIERGSLTSILGGNKGAVELDWVKRMKVIRGVADALSYMHHDRTPPIVHRDLSSKNILLDLEFEACVSDFGTARLIKPDSSNWSTLAGTYGYIAPGMHLR
ncbi:MDIS1-interacting receptor like kinase 2-like [Magnolia sinica]|uniref:MDIS1-interacting receptor like kinase 2-like n=1 Tax=Magnolia sinica TaxID=86752 RepID=UPI002659B46C|nr:MDIS1-interacting receptor like kinase 2-like [Magnolia sinica]